MQAFSEVFHKTGKKAIHHVLCTFAFQAPHPAPPCGGNHASLGTPRPSRLALEGGGKRKPEGAPPSRRHRILTQRI